MQGYKDSLPNYRLEYLTLTDQKVIELSAKDKHPALIFTEVPEQEVQGMMFDIDEIIFDK